MMGTGDLGADTYQPLDVVVDPNKVFRLSKRTSSAAPNTRWSTRETAHDGALRHGPSGLHGQLGFLTPPRPVLVRTPAVGAGLGRLRTSGLCPASHPTEYRVQVFGLHGTFYEEYAHEILFTSDVDALTDFPYENETEDGVILRHEWKAFFDQVLVKEFGAEPLDGHKWATCPCAFAPQT